MKHVYTNSELPHIWVHDWRRVGNGRNQSDTFYFQQNVIYSYGSHFPIARIIDLPNGNTVALETTDSYSNTTARHCSLVSRALHGAITSFSVPDVLADNTKAHLDNWRALRSALNETRNKMERAKRTLDWQINRATSQANDANRYAETFELLPHLEKTEYPLIAYTEAERLRLTEKIRIGELQRETEHIAATARRAEAEAHKAESQRQLAARIARLQALERFTFGLIKAPELRYGSINSRVSAGSATDIKTAIAEWQRGKRSTVPYSYDGPVLLRVSKDKTEVQTSKGVRVSVAECQKLWPELDHSFTNKTRTDDVKQRRLGPYTIQYIQNGDVKAGCHYVTYTEARKLALVMGWTRVTVGDRVKFALHKVTS